MTKSKTKGIKEKHLIKRNHEERKKKLKKKNFNTRNRKCEDLFTILYCRERHRKSNIERDSEIQ